jgi:hypothetical protein
MQANVSTHNKTISNNLFLTKTSEARRTIEAIKSSICTNAGIWSRKAKTGTEGNNRSVVHIRLLASFASSQKKQTIFSIKAFLSTL